MEPESMPTPKFQLGDEVFAPGLDSTTMKHPCPDCGGTGTWTVQSATGANFTIACPRCAMPYSRLPAGMDLTYRGYAPRVDRLHIGQVRMEWPRRYDDDRDVFTYTAGGGAFYYESQLYADREEAARVAQAQADDKNAELAATPERMVQWDMASLDFSAAHLKSHNSAIWSSWYSYNRLLEDIGELIDEKKGPKTFDELHERLESIESWERQHRDGPPLGELLKAAQQAAAGDISPLAAWLAGNAEFLDTFLHKES